ncbi:glycosyltransferase family 9 protein [Celerinatantimonas sp. YJH-8]|uniref:glycosyltransferase family 9 protein n=1 Tax=Celerinatantimonas sp. YJH-8 TaxID=3228714 RepID=UPI0038CA3F01
MFLIPFVRQVRTVFPHAHITLLLNEPWQQQFFNQLNIDQFLFSQFSLKKVKPCLQSLIHLAKEPYDLCLTPFGSSQDAILTALIDAKNKVAYTRARYNDVFTHTFSADTAQRHAALHALALLPQWVGSAPKTVSYQLHLTPEEAQLGHQIRSSMASTSEYCIAFFRGARGKKRLSDETWLKLLSRFEQASPHPITWIEVMEPGMAVPLRPELKSYQAGNLQELTYFLSSIDTFISCDTGPLHLADAVDTPCIGLYTQTNPQVYGLLNKYSVHIEDLEHFDARSVLNITRGNEYYKPLHIQTQRPIKEAEPKLLTYTKSPIY